jgi:hypothetical protein
MSTEQQQPVTPPSTGDSVGTWGAASETQQPKRKRSAKKLAIAVAVAVGIAGAGTAAVYAAGDSTSSSTTSQGPGGTGGGPGGGMGGGGVMSSALHGEYVVSDGNGSYTTELLQNGEVTAISDTSITAKSEDGYTRTYTIDSDTVVGNGSTDLSSIETGDDVTIVATVSGDTATVDTLAEEGTTGQGQMGQMPPDQTDGTAQDSSTTSN